MGLQPLLAIAVLVLQLPAALQAPEGATLPEVQASGEVSLLEVQVIEEEDSWLELGEQACLVGTESTLVCSLQTDQATGRLQFTADALLQGRYLGKDSTRRPWLAGAPSVFPDQELAIRVSTGGFLAGRQITSTAYIDYFWCSEASCETILDVAYIVNEDAGTCDYGIALASIGGQPAGFGLPHSAGVGSSAHEWRDVPVAAVTTGSSEAEVVANRLRCNALQQHQRMEAAPWYIGWQPNLFVIPTRTAARWMSRYFSGFGMTEVEFPFGDGTSACVAFLHPNSLWHASLGLFQGLEPCSGAQRTVALEAIYESAKAYSVQWMNVASLDHGFPLGVFPFEELGIPCTLPPASSEPPPSCPPELGSGCRSVFRFSGSGLSMVGADLRGWDFSGTLDIQDRLGRSPSFFSLLATRVLAEAQQGTAACRQSYYRNRDPPTCDGQAVEFTCPLPSANASRAPITTRDFLLNHTTTHWLTNASYTDGYSWWFGLHGFGMQKLPSGSNVLSLLERSVLKRLQLACTQAVSQTDNILKWAGASCTSFITLVAAVGAGQQGREAWRSAALQRRPLLRLAVTLLLIFGSALVPLGFLVAGEYTTYLQNKQDESFSYLQVSVDVPSPYSIQTKANGGAKLVALVAIQSTYDTAFTGLLYYISAALVLLIIIASMFYRGSKSPVAPAPSEEGAAAQSRGSFATESETESEIVCVVKPASKSVLSLENCRFADRW